MPSGDHNESHPEQPRCGRCGCRRIFHFVMTTYGSKSHTPGREDPVPCTRWINDECDRCGCDRYEPLTATHLFAVLRRYQERNR